jgi:hypothetical protein
VKDTKTYTKNTEKKLKDFGDEVKKDPTNPKKSWFEKLKCSVTPDCINEVCDNKKDDDGDGKIDKADPDCEDTQP